MLFQVAIICCTFILHFNPYHHCAVANGFDGTMKSEALNILNEMEHTIIDTAQKFQPHVMDFKDMSTKFNKNKARSVKSLIKTHAQHLVEPLKTLKHNVPLTGPDPALYNSYAGLRAKPKSYKIAKYYAENPTQPEKEKRKFFDQVLKQFKSLYKDLEAKYIEKNEIHKPQLDTFAMLSAHDTLNNATKYLRKQLLLFLEYMTNENALATALRPKRYAVWAIVENIIKPGLENICKSISPTNNHFRNIDTKIAEQRKIPGDWITAEKQMPDQQQSMVRQNAGGMLLVYEQLKKWTKMFDFPTAVDDLAARKKFAEKLLENSITDVTYDWLMNLTDNAKLQRLPETFGELIYDGIDIAKMFPK